MKKIILLLLLLLSVFFSPAAQAQAKEMQSTTWETLPVLHNGRIKPLDSFARVMLKSFSGQEDVEGLSASVWLRETLFDPATAMRRPIFKIYQGQGIEVEKQENNLYSYETLAAIMQARQKIIVELIERPQEQWSLDQQTLMQHYEHYIVYTQLLRALTPLLPLALENMEDSDTPYNFLDYKKIQQQLDSDVQKIVKEKGSDWENYTPEERRKAMLSFQLQTLQSGGRTNVLFRILPENWDNADTNWVSPWEVIERGKGSPQNAQYLKFWQNMAQAYLLQDNADDFESAAKSAKDFFEKNFRSSDSALAFKLKTERFYNLFNFIRWAELLYLGAFAALLINLFKPNAAFLKLSALSLSVGALIHTLHIVLRVFILNRPPVATLYESVIFVGLICVLGCLGLAWKQKSSTGLIVGSVSGLLLLITAEGFASEDTMNTLVAVLNTNFWLGTHVICISIGYSLCLMTALLGHYYLMMRAAGAQKFIKISDDFSFEALDFNIKTLVILSLLFTTIGTILGGIWADQSWGRFWGWDPKENGALLIVLWLIWMLHSRITGHLDAVRYAAAAAFLAVIVILAWFGVNLLNVGLHSYGFIQGVATAIGIFCAIEILLISALWALAREKKGRALHEN